MSELRALNPELRQIAQTELNEVESRIDSDLTALRDWLSKQPHLKAPQDAQFLVAFLRGCKYSLEKAKSKLDYYYTIRALLPELFANRNIDEKFIALCRSGAYVALPKAHGPGGPRMHLTDYSKFDLKQFKLNDLFHYQALLMERHIYADDNAVISGYIEIIDFSKLSLSLLAQMDFALIKRMGVFAEKGAPLRLKGMYFVNCPKEAVAVLNLTKTLLPGKLQKRFYVFKSFDDLYECIPREYLPVEYGGTNGHVADIQAQTEKALLAYADKFKEDEQYGVNEQLRPGKSINAETLFGIDGSFRKLDID